MQQQLQQLKPQYEETTQQARIAALEQKIKTEKAMVGRFLGAALLRKIKTGQLLAACTVSTATLVTLSMWSMLAVGLFNSIVFPAIFSLG